MHIRLSPLPPVLFTSLRPFCRACPFLREHSVELFREPLFGTHSGFLPPFGKASFLCLTCASFWLRGPKRLPPLPPESFSLNSPSKTPRRCPRSWLRVHGLSHLLKALDRFLHWFSRVFFYCRIARRFFSRSFFVFVFVRSLACPRAVVLDNRRFCFLPEKRPPFTTRSSFSQFRPHSVT